MDIDQLRTFISVARHAHVSRAARELHMAQPAVSRQIRELERECGGVALIEKIGRNVRLTEAGEALLVHAQSILAEVAAAESTMRERLGLTAGRVSIGTPPSVGLHMLPDALAKFHRAYPAIELRIQQAGTAQLLHQLDMGEIDIAVVTLPIPSRGHDIVPLFVEPLVAVFHLAHRFATREDVNISDLSNEAFLLYPSGYEMHEVIIKACRNAGFVPKIVLDGGDVGMLLRLAAAGLGIAIVPRLTIQGVDDIVAKQIINPTLSRSMALVTRSDRTLTPPTRMLLHQLKQSLLR
ncbi:MAG: hypothetical protein RI985_527 [Chloroflexota bacterium]|jgi:DNA-binding transcriptional LysR family regulator